MLLAHEPAHVGKEEASVHIVRIRVGLGELVVDPVIPRPLVQVVLWNGGETTARTTSHFPR